MCGGFMGEYANCPDLALALPVAKDVAERVADLCFSFLAKEAYWWVAASWGSMRMGLT